MNASIHNMVVRSTRTRQSPLAIDRLRSRHRPAGPHPPQLPGPHPLLAMARSIEQVPHPVLTAAQHRQPPRMVHTSGHIAARHVRRHRSNQPAIHRDNSYRPPQHSPHPPIHPPCFPPYSQHCGYADSSQSWPSGPYSCAESQNPSAKQSPCNPAARSKYSAAWNRQQTCEPNRTTDITQLHGARSLRHPPSRPPLARRNLATSRRRPPRSHPRPRSLPRTAPRQPHLRHPHAGRSHLLVPPPRLVAGEAPGRRTRTRLRRIQSSNSANNPRSTPKASSRSASSVWNHRLAAYPESQELI